MKIAQGLIVDKELINTKLTNLKDDLKFSSTWNCQQISNEIALLEEILANSKPLEPIIRNAYSDGLNEGCNCDNCLDLYINETEI